MRTLIYLIVGMLVLVGCNSTNVKSDQQLQSPAGELSLQGTWEGEFQTPTRPIFITLHLNRDDEDWNGVLVALGQRHPLESVVPTENGVRATLVPGPGGFALEASIADDKLSGWVSEGNERYPVELDLVPNYPDPESRDKAWAQDIEVLTRRFLKYDRSFAPAKRQLFRDRMSRLSDQIPQLDDSEIIARMASAVALAENAHTRLYLLRNRTELRRLPIRLWWFDDGLYVVRTESTHDYLLGCRVDEIEETPVHLVREKVSTAFAGNSSWENYKSTYYMTSPEILHAFGIASDQEKIEFAFSDCKNQRDILAPLAFNRSSEPLESWWDLSPFRSSEGWVQVLEKSAVTPPLYLRHPDHHYWFEYLDEDNLLYFQYNRASEMERESMDDFGERLLEALEKQKVDTLVLDLRFNTGGSLGLAKDLMAELERRTKDISRVLITGRATFSAGIAHVASWMEAGNVKIIGEPVGDKFDYWSEGGNIILPNSGLAAHFANAFHSYSQEPCPNDVPCFLDLSSPELRPHILTNATWTEYIAGTDVALDAARLQTF